MAVKESLTPEQVEAVCMLKGEGKSGRIVAAECARGVSTPGGQVAPFTVSPSHANTVYRRRQRDRETISITDLAKRPAGEAVATLVARAISIAERELDAHARAQARGQLDHAAFRRTTASLKDLEGMARRLPSGNGGDDSGDDDQVDAPTDAQPSGFMGHLLTSETEHDSAPAPPPMPQPVTPAQRLPSTPAPQPAAPPQPAPPSPLPQSVSAQIQAAAKVGKLKRQREHAPPISPASNGGGPLAQHAAPTGGEARDDGSAANAAVDSQQAGGQGDDRQQGTGMLGERAKQGMPSAVQRVLDRRLRDA